MPLSSAACVEQVLGFMCDDYKTRGSRECTAPRPFPPDSTKPMERFPHHHRQNRPRAVAVQENNELSVARLKKNEQNLRRASSGGAASHPSLDVYLLCCMHIEGK